MRVGHGNDGQVRCRGSMGKGASVWHRRPMRVSDRVGERVNDRRGPEPL